MDYFFIKFGNTGTPRGAGGGGGRTIRSCHVNFHLAVEKASIASEAEEGPAHVSSAVQLVISSGVAGSVGP